MSLYANNDSMVIQWLGMSGATNGMAKGLNAARRGGGLDLQMRRESISEPITHFLLPASTCVPKRCF